MVYKSFLLNIYISFDETKKIEPLVKVALRSILKLDHIRSLTQVMWQEP